MSDASPPAAATPAFQSSPVNSKQCAAPGRTACPRRGRPLSPPTPRPRRLRAPRRLQVQPDHDAQGGASQRETVRPSLPRPKARRPPAQRAPARPRPMPARTRPGALLSQPPPRPQDARACHRHAISRVRGNKGRFVNLSRGGRRPESSLRGERLRAASSARGGRTALARLSRALPSPPSQRTPIRPPPSSSTTTEVADFTEPPTSETPTTRGLAGQLRGGECAPRLQPRSRFEVHSPTQEEDASLCSVMSIRRRRTNRSVPIALKPATGLL